MILYGDRGESGKIYLTPSDGATFEPGKQYRVSVNIKDIGKVPLILQSVCHFLFLTYNGRCNIHVSNAKDRIRPHFYTPRRESKIRHEAEYNCQTPRCLEMWSNTVLSV